MARRNRRTKKNQQAYVLNAAFELGFQIRLTKGSKRKAENNLEKIGWRGYNTLR